MDGRATEIRNVVLDLLTQLRMALGQLRLYPASSPQVQKVITPAHALVATFPGVQGKIILARTLRGLLVNSKRLPAGDASAMAEQAWLQVLQDSHVNSLIIHSSITPEHLTTFLDGLARKFWDLKDGKAINARLREGGVHKAWVEEVQFVAMAKGDLLIEGAANKLAAAGARVSEIVQTLEQVIDGTVSEGLSEQVRLEIMRKLLDQDPSLVQKAQAMNFANDEENGGDGGGTGSGPGTGRKTLFGTGRSPGWISFDQTRKSLAEIHRLLKTSDAENREALRSLGHVLLGGFRYDPLLAELLKKFLTDEGIDLVPDWMNEEKKQEPPPEEPEGPPAPVQRATDILALQEESRIEALWEEAAALAKELVGLKRADLIGELVKTLDEHARHAAGNHRLKSIKLMIQIYPLLEAEELKGARAGIEGRAREALGLERDKGIYPSLVDLAVLAIENLLLRGTLEQAAPILEALRKQHQTDDKDYPDRRPISFRGIEKLASGSGLHPILERIRAKNPLAVRMVESFGLAAAKSLVERMKISDSVAERMDLAQLILRAGPDAGAVLADEVQQVRAPSEALRLLDLIPHAMAEAQAEAALGITLRHPALAVRRRAASFLGGRGYPRAGAHLVEALKKEIDPSARVLFVETLGILKHDAALATLGQILEARSETDDVRGAAAAALGSLGKPQAVPLLTRASAKGRGLALVLNAAPTAVRTAAVRALAAYTRHPECREALRRSQEDPDAVVRDAARESLLFPIVKVFGDAARKAAVASDIEQFGRILEGGAAGFLSEVPLDQICQLLEEGGRTGLLLLNVGGFNAQVHVAKGDVVAAEYNGVKGQEAFNQFCRWEGTYFMFASGVAAPNPGPSQSIIKMLMDACEVREKTERPGPPP